MIDNDPLAGKDPENDSKGEIGVDHNPTGPFANLKDRSIQDAIIRLAGWSHAACVTENPKLSKFADFLDVLTSSWLEQKAEVEREAQKHGFIPCHSTTEILLSDRGKVALLALTLNGSFVLLGNGCLGQGGSGHYEKIPYRKADGQQKYRADYGIRVAKEAELQERLNLEVGDRIFTPSTSPLFALYYTTQNLTPEKKLEVAVQLSETLRDSIRRHMDETIRAPTRHRGEGDEEVPEKRELQPMY